MTQPDNSVSREPQWLVRAWVTAPGEFPSKSLMSYSTQAVDIQGALRQAARHWPTVGIEPFVVVSARRTKPSTITPP